MKMDDGKPLKIVELLSFVEQLYHSDKYTSWSEMDAHNDTTIIDDFISLIELLQYPERLLKLTYSEGQKLINNLDEFLPEGNEKDQVFIILDVGITSSVSNHEIKAFTNQFFNQNRESSCLFDLQVYRDRGFDLLQQDPVDIEMTRGNRMSIAMALATIKRYEQVQYYEYLEGSVKSYRGQYEPLKDVLSYFERMSVDDLFDVLLDHQTSLLKTIDAIIESEKRNQ